MAQVAIIGGGPAGSALGSYLSMAGIENVILEKAIHPREHVGESMVTSSTRVFQELGFLPTMEEAGFVRKYGASWHPVRKRGSLRIEFSEFPQPGIDQDYTYHVDRGKLDLLLLKHAESLGSKVYQGVHVKRVLFEGGQACGVRFEIGGQAVDHPARVVVDASGRGTLLGKQLGYKENDPLFNQFAVHAWFEDVDRGELPDDIHIHFLPVTRGWVWQIPITDAITSMGVVAEKSVLKESHGDHAGWFEQLIRSAPDISAAMSRARRVNDFKIEADYSYGMRRFVGPGFLLVGDAARFVDPIFSSGVSVALYSAKFAAERIRHAFEVGDFGEAVFRPYEERLRKGTKVWYEFICLYYKLLPIFTHFIRSTEYRLQVLQLLQGEVFDRDSVPVLEAMRKYIDTVESTQKHLMQPALDPSIDLDATTPSS